MDLPDLLENQAQDNPLFFQLFHRMAEPALLIRSDQIIDANPAAIELFHARNREELCFCQVSDILTVNAPGCQAPTGTKNIPADTGSSGAGFVIPCHNGEKESVEILCTPLTIRDEECVHVIIRPVDNQLCRNLCLDRDLGLALSEISDLHAALDLILSESLKIKEIDCGGIFLLDASTGDLILESYIGISPAFIRCNACYPAHSELNSLIMKGTPAYLHPSDFGDEFNEIIRAEGVQAVASIPMRKDGLIIGSLNIGSRTVSDFSPDTRVMIEILASQIGGAIARIRDAEALQQSRFNLQNLFDSIPDYIAIFDEDCRIVMVNHALSECLHADSELTGTNILDLCSPSDRDEILRMITSIGEGGGATCLTLIVTRDGSKIPIAMKVTGGIWSGRRVFFSVSRNLTNEQTLQQILNETKDLNEKIISTSHYGMLVFQGDTSVCIRANTAASCIIGNAIHEIIGQNLGNLILWNNPRLRELVRKTIESEKKHQSEIHIISSNGRELWADFTFIPFTSNHSPHLLITIEDISEKKKNETENRMKEAIMTSIARAGREFLSETPLSETLSVLLEDVGAALKVDHVSYFQNFYEPDTGEIHTGLNMVWTSPRTEPGPEDNRLQNIPGSLVPEILRRLAGGMLVHGIAGTFDDPVRDFLETQGIRSILIVPIHVNDVFQGFIGVDDHETDRIWTPTEMTMIEVVADIIGSAFGRKAMQDALHAAEQELSEIIENLPDATMVINASGVVTSWNRAMEELTGISSAEMIGQGNYQYAIPFHGKREPILIDYALSPDTIPPKSPFKRLQDNTIIEEISLQNRNETRYLWACTSPITDQEGNIIGAIESIRDITGKVKADQEIIRYNQELEKKNQELDELSTRLIQMNLELDRRVEERTTEINRLLQIKSDLITRIGHDLKTPLTPITALLPEVTEHTQDPEVLACLSIITRSASRLNNVVSTILNYSRLNLHPDMLHSEGIPVRELFDQAVLDNRKDIRKQNLTISNEIPSSMLLFMAENHAEAIVLNLISNAVKYSVPDGSITIEPVRDIGYGGFCVSDTGIGMTPEECSQAFEEFYRADSSRHDGSASGLGLAIVSRIVSLYGGKISAFSEGKGKGSRFCVMFDPKRITCEDATNDN